MKQIDCCPICGSTPAITLNSKIPVSSGSTGIYQKQVETYAIKLCGQKEPREKLSICGNCRSVYRAIFFDSEELRAIYQSEYIGMEDEVSEEIVYHDEDFLRESAARTMELVKNIEHQFGATIKDVFDIGGRDGFRVKALAEAGYACKVFDPIPCETCSPLIAKDFVLCSGMEEGERADLIILGSMLEHCENPHEIIESCHTHLRDGGFLFLDLPYDVATFFEWLIWRRWAGKSLGIDYTHNIFYTRRTVQHLLGMHGVTALTGSYTTIPSYKGSVLMTVLGRKVGPEEDVSMYEKWRSSGFDLFIPLHFNAILHRIVRRIRGGA